MERSIGLIELEFITPPVYYIVGEAVWDKQLDNLS